MNPFMKHEKGSGALPALFIVTILITVASCIYWSCHSSGTSSAKSLKSMDAPFFTLKDIQGEEFSSSQLMGKPAVLNFFATWCPSCREEIPGFVDVYEKYRSGFELIGIALDSDPQVLPPFIARQKIQYKILVGNLDVVRLYGGFQTIPTTFFIGKDGKIKNVLIGYISNEVFEREVLKLL